MNKQEIGRRLYESRINAGLKMKDVSHIVKQSNLSSMENGNKSLSEKVAIELSKIYGVDYQYLLGYQEYENEKARILSTINAVQKNATTHYGYFEMLGYKFYTNSLSDSDIGEHTIKNLKSGQEIHINQAVEYMLIDSIDRMICGLFDSYFESDVQYLKYKNLKESDDNGNR